MSGESRKKKSDPPDKAEQERWVKGVQKVMGALRRVCERALKDKKSPEQEKSS